VSPLGGVRRVVGVIGLPRIERFVPPVH
jgi:hypothetical protein